MNIVPSSGTFNQPIELWAITKTQDGSGQEVDTDSKVTDLMASVNMMSAGEHFKSGREMAETFCRFRIRHYSGLIPKLNFIVWRGSRYDIINIVADGRMNSEYHTILGQLLETWIAP